MDKIDRKILRELDKDARKPFSQIATSINESRQVVKYRYDRMLDNDILKGTYSMINNPKLGKTAFRTFVRFGKISPEKEREIIEFVQDMPNLFWLASFYGKWDLVFQFLETNVSAFEKRIQPIIERYEDYFRERVLTTITELYEYPRQFLYNESVDFLLESTGELSEPDIDDTDDKILKILAKNARATSADIAKTVGLTREAVAKRINRLKKEDYLLGFRPDINFKKLGYLQIKVFLFFHNYTMEREAQLMTYLRHHPNVAFGTKALSLANKEFEIYVKDINEFYEVMREIRNEFGDIIKEYDSVIIPEVHKVNYYP